MLGLVKNPCISHIKIFRCIAYIKVSNNLKSKFETKSTRCVFFGYSEATKVFKLMNLEVEKIMKSNNIEFIEPENNNK